MSLKTDFAISPQGIATFYAYSGADRFTEPEKDIRLFGFTSAFV